MALEAPQITKVLLSISDSQAEKLKALNEATCDVWNRTVLLVHKNLEEGGMALDAAKVARFFLPAWKKDSATTLRDISLTRLSGAVAEFFGQFKDDPSEITFRDAKTLHTINFSTGFFIDLPSNVITLPSIGDIEYTNAEGFRAIESLDKPAKILVSFEEGSWFAEIIMKKPAKQDTPEKATNRKKVPCIRDIRVYRCELVYNAYQKTCLRALNQACCEVWNEGLALQTERLVTHKKRVTLDQMINIHLAQWCEQPGRAIMRGGLKQLFVRTLADLNTATEYHFISNELKKFPPSRDPSKEVNIVFPQHFSVDETAKVIQLPKVGTLFFKPCYEGNMQGKPEFITVLCEDGKLYADVQCVEKVLINQNYNKKLGSDRPSFKLTKEMIAAFHEQKAREIEALRVAEEGK